MSRRQVLSYAMYRSGSQACCNYSDAASVLTCAEKLARPVPFRGWTAHCDANLSVMVSLMHFVVFGAILWMTGLSCEGAAMPCVLQLGPNVAPLLAVPYMFSDHVTHCVHWAEGIGSVSHGFHLVLQNGEYGLRFGASSWGCASAVNCPFWSSAHEEQAKTDGPLLAVGLRSRHGFSAVQLC